MPLLKTGSIWMSSAMQPIQNAPRISSIPSGQLTTFSPTRLRLLREASRPYLGWQSLSMTPTSLLCWRYALHELFGLFDLQTTSPKLPLDCGKLNVGTRNLVARSLTISALACAVLHGKMKADPPLPVHPNGTVQLTDDIAVDITIVNYGGGSRK
jgi:hypothetical protein